MAAAAAASVKESVKESLLGTEESDSQPSNQTKAAFEQHATKDPESGELYMSEKEFVDAIAPPNEDYVSIAIIICSSRQSP